MDRYVIAVTDQDNTGAELWSHFIKLQKDLADDVPFEALILDTYIQVILTTQSQKHTWLNLKHCKEHCSELSTLGEDHKNSTQNSELNIDSLHEAADNLPSQGCHVLVFVQLSSHIITDTESQTFVALYAVLKRLRVWHNAVIKFVSPNNSTDEQTLPQWTSHLQAEVIGSVKEITLPSQKTIWLGQLAILDSRKFPVLSLKDLVLELQENPSAFSEKDEPIKNSVKIEDDGTALEYLQSRNLSDFALNSTCEILEEVDLVTLPSFMLSPCQLRLKCCPGSDASEFLKQVNSNTEVGYVLRIGYRLKEGISLCSEGSRSTVNWKETISANINSIFDVQECGQEVLSYLHLLLSSSATQHDSADSMCTAYILRSSKEINGGLVDFLYSDWIKSGKCSTDEIANENTELDKLFSDLPLLDVEYLNNLDYLILDTQRRALQDWLEERQKLDQSVLMSEKQLRTLLSDIHRNVITIALETCDSVGATQTKQYIFSERRENLNKEGEWPEKEALKLSENKSCKLSRFVSSESLQQSSPVQPSEGGDKSVDVKDFLKLFLPDGSAAGQTLSLLQTKTGSVSMKTLSSFDEKETKWPESKEVKYHDIYYNHGKRCERLELEYAKLRQRHVMAETRSTVSSNSSGVLDHSCTTIMPKPLKKLARSPVRRSPRKHPPPREHVLSRPKSFDLSALKKSNQVEEKATKKVELIPVLSQVTSTQPIKSSVSKKTSQKADSAKEDIPPKQSNQSKSAKEKSSRSDRHKRRLLQIVHAVLKTKGIKSDHDLYKACSDKLFKVTKLYAMELTTSRNLVEEMTKIAQGQVQLVIDLEMMKRKPTN